MSKNGLVVNQGQWTLYNRDNQRGLNLPFLWSFITTASAQTAKAVSKKNLHHVFLVQFVMDHNFTPRLRHIPPLFVRQFAKLPFQTLKLSRIFKTPKNNLIRILNSSRPYYVMQKKKLTMPFWLRDLFNFSWRPATPADILRAWELLKDKSGYIGVWVELVRWNWTKCSSCSTSAPSGQICAWWLHLPRYILRAGEGHQKAMIHKWSSSKGHHLELKSISLAYDHRLSLKLNKHFTKTCRNT